MNFPVGSDGKESVFNVGDLGLIPGSGRSPLEGNGNPLQYSYLENSMERGATFHKLLISCLIPLWLERGNCKISVL